MSTSPTVDSTRASQQAMLDELLLAAEDLTSLIPQIEQSLIPIFGPVRVGLMFWDYDRSVLQMVRGSFGAPERMTASCQLDPRHLHHHIAALVFGLEQTYVIDDATHDPGIRPAFAEAFAIERLVSLPLVVDSRSIGILHIARAGEAFSAADIEQCNAIAPRVAIAVESTRMLMRLGEQRRVEAVLTQEAVAIASGTESRATFEDRLGELRAVFGADLVALVPIDGEPVVAKVADLPTRVEQRVLDEASREEAERAAFQRPRHAGDPGSATLYVPVRLGTRFVGTLVTFRQRHESFTAEERHGLSRMANLIALSWAWVRFQQQRADLARLEERLQIADDLHDDVAHILVAAQTQLDGILEHAEISEDSREHAARARALLVRADTAIRHVTTETLRPATTLGDRLQEVVDAVDQQFMLPVRLEIADQAGDVGQRASRAAIDTIVKVAREALVNVAKHAGPCRASVILDVRGSDQLWLRVSDTGTGSARRGTAESHGLTSLRRSVRRHGGSLRVTRSKPGGTVVTVTLPP